MPNQTATHDFHWDREALSILVEEEGRVRRYWREFFEQEGVSLRVYDSHEFFLRDLEAIKGLGKKVQFFFDQEMGKWRGVGTELARAVRDLTCRASTALVTAHCPEFFSRELNSGLLDQVFDKYPTEIFGSEFFRNRVRKEMREGDEEALFTESLAGLDAALRTNFIFKQDFKIDPAFLPAPSMPIEIRPETANEEKLVSPHKPWWTRLREFIFPNFELPPEEFRHIEELQPRRPHLLVGNRYYLNQERY